MHHIRAARAADLDAVVALLARLQPQPAHLIAYHGNTGAELAEEFADWPDWQAGSVLASCTEQGVDGFLGAEVDAGLGRAWLHGPYVDLPAKHPAGEVIWQRTADELHRRVRALPVLNGITDLELCGHAEHSRLADFALRNGFHAGELVQVMTLDGDGLRSLLVRAAPQERSAVVALPPDRHAAVIALHEQAFPDRYTSGQQLVSRLTTVVALAGDRLLGYAAGSAQAAELYVDYVAVRPDVRGRGFGADLVVGLLRELALRKGARPRACATVRLANTASSAMLSGIGFRVELDLVGYRTR